MRGLAIRMASALALLASPGAFALEPFVRASLSGDESPWVGQQVTMIVELLAPGYFSSAVNFDLPDPEVVLLMPPAGHPVVGSETIDGQHYTVQRHSLRAWPMQAGSIEIPPMTARFSFKRNPLDTETVPASLVTPQVSLAVKQPPGAENLGLVISARNLKVEESWDPQPGGDPVKAGTAFKRTVTFTAPGVPGMLIPPAPANDIDGLGVYSKRQLMDQDNRGSLTGVRRDEITYVCKRPGQFTIPETTFTWYDLDAGKLRTETLAAQTFDVIINPDLDSSSVKTTASLDQRISIDWRVALAALGLVALLLTALLSSRARNIASAMLAGLTRPLRPVHLQPLNPGAHDD